MTKHSATVWGSSLRGSALLESAAAAGGAGAAEEQAQLDAVPAKPSTSDGVALWVDARSWPGSRGDEPGGR